MSPSVDAGALRQMHPSEYLMRFAFGGSMTAMAGLIARTYGPAIGGLFLAFPAILPASLTLAAQHGGRHKAIGEAQGAVLGALALGGFAAVVSMLAVDLAPPLTIAVAAAVWLATGCLLWSIFYGGAK